MHCAMLKELCLRGHLYQIIWSWKKLQLFGSRRKLALLLHSAAALFKDTHHNALLHQTHLYEQTNRKTCAWDLIGGHIHTSSRWFVQPEQAWCIFTADGASHRDTHCVEPVLHHRQLGSSGGQCSDQRHISLYLKVLIFENLWKGISFYGIVLVQ